MRRIELVAFADALFKKGVKVSSERMFGRFFFRTQPQMNYLLTTRWNVEEIVRGCFCAKPFWIHRCFLAIDDAFVEGVFHVRSQLLRPVKFRTIRLVLRKQELRNFAVRSATRETQESSQRIMGREQRIGAGKRETGFERTTFVRATP